MHRLIAFLSHPDVILAALTVIVCVTVAWFGVGEIVAAK